MFCEEAKKRAIPVSINTNALLIDPSMAEFLVNYLVVISISIDATTKETLLKTRSTDNLDAIINAVNMLLDMRKKNAAPRIIVSFTEEDCNVHEKESFINYWITQVDAIRVNKAYSDVRKIDSSHQVKRIPCREIYDSLNIDFDGTARMCCLDGYRETNLGNVFQEGILNVWKGKLFENLRLGHEQGGEHLNTFCRECDQWAGFNIIKEHEDKGLLIRETAYSTYYNRLDRMSNWSPLIKRNDIAL